MKPSEVLLSARDQVTEDTWTQGFMVSGGQRCAVGHIRAAANSYDEHTAARRYADRVANRVGFDRVEQFNDDPDRLWSDVWALLDDAAREAKSEGE